MAKKKRKVVKRKLIGFDQPMLDGMTAKLQAGFAKNETEVLRKLLTGAEQFEPEIEAYISSCTKAAPKLSREYVIRRLLVEAIERRDPKLRLP